MAAADEPIGQRAPLARTALALWLAALIGTACVLPYVLTLVPQIGQKSGHLPLSRPALVVISLVQSAVLLGVMTFCGLWAARRLGMGAPVVDAWVNGRPTPPHVARGARTAALLGLAAGLAMLAMDLWLFAPLSPEGVGRLVRQPQPPAWMGLLASVEGGLTEEVELRLFLLSVIALALRRVTGGAHQAGTPLMGSAVFWTANIVAAVLFGLGHLPVTSRLVSLTPVVVARALVLNGLVGVIAGVLFRRRGIEAAMVCHFSADLIFHVAAPLAQTTLLRLIP
jgi:membrane protease YdiL (CAAX protease family)